uniref:Uncharacterized protein n=1 Tax=Oryza nivara TaxID=4536 RepID=A0A0E0G8F1_ORYNI
MIFTCAFWFQREAIATLIPNTIATDGYRCCSFPPCHIIFPSISPNHCSLLGSQIDIPHVLQVRGNNVIVPSTVARIVVVATIQVTHWLPHSTPFDVLNRRLTITTNTTHFLLGRILTNTLQAVAVTPVRRIGRVTASSQCALKATIDKTVGLNAMDGSLGEEARGGPAGVRGREDPRPVAVVPEVDAAGAVEAVGERLHLVVRRDGEQVGRRRRGGGGVGGVGVPGALEVRGGVAELGALAHLVELALPGEARLEQLLGLPRLHPLPLPLGDAAGERARAAAHADGEVPAPERRARAGLAGGGDPESA